MCITHKGFNWLIVATAMNTDDGGCGGDGERLSWRGESSKKGIRFCKKIQLGHVALHIPYASKISLVEVGCSESTINCVVAKISTEMFARLKY